ncbi:MAG: RNA polymerase sigma factor [Verrucomicrobiota bacterium]|nr:RNA polymerase sigma factor [Verrucomicrobiota bacterium]
MKERSKQPSMSDENPAVDTAWVRQVAESEGAGLTRYAYSLCGDIEAAHDAVQDTFLRLLRQPRSRIESYIKPWLFTVVRSRVVDLKRKEARMTPMDTPAMAAQPSAERSPAATAETGELACIALKLLETLPEAQREAIRLKYQTGLSYEEIARVMDRSVNAVGLLLHEGLRTLRQKLKETKAVPA